ncbi:hypothetical protein Pla108_26800 [Botrimarina colliarenosi]|uniref:Uncharacterized protein n=1 Tax=Botrimarina colliarenosi TaxID=2528001 RepID=A0A5C6AA56_9BACT|nr:hypothetical protein [Botrimarina colliarenosi]TWT96904.1 hypothetical protein Pla108_26800 [Botrimarina colliarenosi]
MTEIDDCFAQCRSLLTEQRAALVKTRDDALATAERASKTLAKLDRALTGLSTGSKRSTDAAPRAKRACSNRPEVLATIHAALGAGPLDAATLKTRVTQRLRDEGRNLSMFAKLFESCLADPTLACNDQGVYRLPGAAGWKAKGPAAETLL